MPRCIRKMLAWHNSIYRPDPILARFTACCRVAAAPYPAYRPAPILPRFTACCRVAAAPYPAYRTSSVGPVSEAPPGNGVLRLRLTQILRRFHHVRQRATGFRPATGFQAAIRVNPQALYRDTLSRL